MARTYGGYQGDTLASALLANGQRPGRAEASSTTALAVSSQQVLKSQMHSSSCAPAEDTSQIPVATVVELYDGLDANSQNRWPSLKFDFLSVKPIRRPVPRRRVLLQDVHVARVILGTGLRNASSDAPPVWAGQLKRPIRITTKRPTPIAISWSLAPAPRASWPRSPQARAGARVLIADDGDPRFGGALLDERVTIDGKSGSDWVRRIRWPNWKAMPNVRIFQRTTVFGRYDAGTYGSA